MAGDLKAKYASSASWTWTSFNSLAGSSTFVAGAMSAPVEVSNASNLWLDMIVAGLVTWGSTAPAAGTYRLDVHVYGSINDTPTYPKDGSGNDMGTDAARTFATADDKFNATALWQSVTLAATASKVYTAKPQGLVQLFGGVQLPNRVGLWATHGVTTGSSTPHSSGNTWSYTPVLAQYT